MAQKEYRMVIQKDQREGEPVLSSASPKAESSTSPAASLAKTVFLGYGSILANRTYSTITSEVRASGNEELAQTLGNLGRATGIVSAAIASKGLSLIPEAISGIAEQITRVRRAERETRIARYETNLKGSRVNYNQGRVYFD